MSESADKYVRHAGENLWNFDVVVSPGFENISHIHPLKQRDTARLIEAVKNDRHILAVIVFGSAVRFDCNSHSDLDVLLVRDDDELTISAALDGIESEMDIIFSSRLGKRLEEEIARTGVVVYRRKEDV